jgi:hypothetical protein
MVDNLSQCLRLIYSPKKKLKKMQKTPPPPQVLKSHRLIRVLKINGTRICSSTPPPLKSQCLILFRHLFLKNKENINWLLAGIYPSAVM